ncbi:GL15431 [Drosophila persimilis]|uniref:GL15431 n=1 Tax=Drosophila persimilis TaxID=7234 RepID=B4GPV5_DROPE|nr:GL15431 [Drosophila persimilis]
MKARRLLFSTDVGSHQVIIRARVEGNERMELEGVTAWTNTGCDTQSSRRLLCSCPKHLMLSGSSDMNNDCISVFCRCDGTTCDNYDNVHDEADYCKRPRDFQCPINKVSGKTR